MGKTHHIHPLYSMIPPKPKYKIGQRVRFFTPCNTLTTISGTITQVLWVNEHRVYEVATLASYDGKTRVAESDIVGVADA